MKEKIMNFLKSKPADLRLSNISPETKFIIFGAFYTLIAIPAFAQIRMFDLFTFFGIYIVIKHILSHPILSKKKPAISFAIIIILILECCLLFIYVFSILLEIELEYDALKNRGSKTVFSFFLFLIYLIAIRIKSNPHKISEIVGIFIFEAFQFCGLIIFYFFVIKLIQESFNFSYLNSLIAINIIILVSTNILAKRVSLILEILCLGYLFLALTLHSVQLPPNNHLSFQDNIAVLIIIILNLIGSAIIFLKNKNYAEKNKILLLVVLMPSFFFPQILFPFYLISTFMIARFIIVYEKLSTSNANIFFVILIFIIFFISIPLNVGRGGFTGFLLMLIALLDIIILPIIVFFSNRTLKKRKLKNDIQNLKIN